MKYEANQNLPFKNIEEVSKYLEDNNIQAMEFCCEGIGLSVDDIVNETQFTYIALDVEPWRLNDKDGNIIN